MDKVTLNKQVVVMRKFVKQAKTRAINRYVKEIKLFQNRKGKEEEVLKLKRKADRLLSKVAILKKIRPDDVSRLALLKAKDWKVILAQKDVPLDDQCYALLANCEGVQEEVEKFHTTHSNLVPKLPSLIKEWQVQSTAPKLMKVKNKHLIENVHSNTLNELSHLQANKVVESCSEEDKQAREIEEFLQNIRSEVDLKATVNDQNETSLVFGMDQDERNGTSGTIDNENNMKGDIDSVVSNPETDSEDESCIQNSKDLPIGHRNPNIIKGKEINSNSDNKFTLERGNLGSAKNKITDNSSSFKVRKQQTNLDTDIDNLTRNPTNIQSKLKAISENLSLNHKPCKSKRKSEVGNNSKAIAKLDLSEIQDLEVGKQQRNFDTDIDNFPRKPTNIQSKLKKISENLSLNNKPRKSKQKPEDGINTKAITKLDLSEIQDLEEIPIAKAESMKISEEVEEESNKHKGDPFFLGAGKKASCSTDGDRSGDDDDDDRSGEDDDKQTNDYQSFENSKQNHFKKGKPKGGFSARESFRGKSSRGKTARGHFSGRGSFQGKSPRGGRSEFSEKNFKNRKDFAFRGRNSDFNINGKFDSKYKKHKFDSDNKFGNKPEGTNFKRDFSAGSARKNGNMNTFNKKPFQEKIPNSASKKEKNNLKPLHPSWEAKRKLKESTVSKFQGKRTVFND